MKHRIKVNDKVQVRAGRERGKDGKVIQVLPVDEMIVIEGLHKMYKHIRARKQGEKGQRIEFSAPVHVSKVTLICPKCSKSTRVGFSKTGDKRQRTCKKCKAIFD